MIPAHVPLAVREAERTPVASAAAEGEPDRYMLRAARAVADSVRVRLRQGEEVLALVGGGDNGGDALYAAAMLADEGVAVRAVLVSDHPHARALEAATRARVEVEILPLWSSLQAPGEGDLLCLPASMRDRDLLDAPVWIDGVLGTGASAPIRRPLATVIEFLAEQAKRRSPFVVAVDMPSGLWHPDGEVEGPVLPADHVVTMVAAKTPLLLPPACHLAGSVEVADIGIPAPTAAVGGMLEAADVAGAHLVPGVRDHKYTRGVVSAAVGSRSYPGAGVLAVRGALGAGPGMVRLLADPRVEALVVSRHPAVVTVPGRFQAGVVGPGMDEESRARAEALAGQCLRKGLPLVVDAEALGLVDSLHRAHGSLAQVILTPHAGEAAVLLSALRRDEGVTRTWVEAHPVAAGRLLAEASGAVVVLKGARTVVVAPDGRICVAPTGIGWAGVAGAGDVLAGVLATLAAAARVRAEAATSPGGRVTVDMLEVAARGVWIHAEAARAASLRLGAVGGPILPDDIAEAVPGVIGAALEQARPCRR